MPVVTDRMAFLHIPKCGGSWVAQILINHYKAQHIARGHDPITEIPDEVLATVLAFTVLRDPWSWYLSWYQHAMYHPSFHKALKEYGRGSLEFKDVLYGVTHPWEIDLEFKYPLVIAPGERMWKGFRAGLMSWGMFSICGKTLRVALLIDMHRLRWCLEHLLKRELPEDQFPMVNTRMERRTSVIEDPQALYDDEMLQWVAQADAQIIHLMGYRRPFQRAESPMVWM